MGNKSRTNGFKSKGQRPNLKKKLQNEMRREYMKSPERIMNQLKSHKAGKKTMVTVPNPNKNNTKERFIRIPGKEYFGATK